MEIRSQRYGHSATFYLSTNNRNISPRDAAGLVSWGPSEIAVPSGSLLDTRAVVRLRNVGASARGAKIWCRNNRADLIAVDPPSGSLTFQVSGFSRYRYVDSDSDEDELIENNTNNTRGDLVTPVKSPHRSAGRTPYRRGRTALSPSDSDDNNNTNLAEERRNIISSINDTLNTTPRQGSTIGWINVDEDTAAPTDEESKSNASLGDNENKNDNSPAKFIPKSAVPPAIQSAQFWSRNSHGPDISRTRNALFHSPLPLLPSQQQHTAYADNHNTILGTNETRVTVFDDDDNEDDMDVVIPTPLKQVRRTVRFSDAGMKDGTPGTDVDRGDVEADADMMDLSGSTPARLPSSSPGDNENQLQVMPSSRFALAQQQLPFPSLKNSRFSGNEGCYDDLCLALGRSFRIGFSNSCDGVVVKPVFAQVGPLASNSKFLVHTQHFFTNQLDKFNRTSFVAYLRTHLTSWKEQDMQTTSHARHSIGYSNSMHQDDSLEPMQEKSERTAKDSSNNTRRLKVPSLKSVLLNELVAEVYLEALMGDLKQGADTEENCRYSLVLFGLVQALTKSSEGQGRTGSHNNLLSRLFDWALGLAGTVFDQPIPAEPSLRKAVLLMSNGNVQLAAEAAIEAGHTRLGLLIARALESPKDTLRDDAEAQLLAYNLTGREINQIRRKIAQHENEVGMGNDIDLNDDEDDDSDSYSVLDAPSLSAISEDEVMILLLLSGQVAPVARHLKLSWYRVFIMELIHGSGCCDMPQENRVTAAVQAIAESKVSVQAAHGKTTEDVDAAYHLLRLLCNSTTSYPITSGLFSPRSIGFRYAPLDARFSWFLYQVLSSLVPTACDINNDNNKVSWRLAQDFATQLFASKLPLWAYYVLCSGEPPEEALKETLIKKWPELSADWVEWNVGGESTITRNSEDGILSEGDEGAENNNNDNDGNGNMGAEPFLVSVLGVPVEWIHEAKAVQHHYEGDAMNECLQWMWTRTTTGMNKAHNILVHQIFPNALSLYKTYELVMVRKHLNTLANAAHGHCNIIGWSTEGGLVLDYLTHIADIPNIGNDNNNNNNHSESGAKMARRRILACDINLLRSMAQRVPALDTAAATVAKNNGNAKHGDLNMRFVTQKMADDIIAAHRAQLIVNNNMEEAAGEALYDGLLTDLENMPTSDAAKHRIVDEVRLIEGSPAVAARFASAHPMYYRHVADALSN